MRLFKKACGNRIAGCFAAGIMAVMLSAAIEVPAATFIWSGSGADNNWSTSGNWTGNVAPPNDGTAVIVLAGSNQLTPNVDVAWTVNSLSFSNNAGLFVLGGNSLTLHGGIANNSANNQTINNAITLQTSQTWNAAAGMLTFNGNINNVTNLLTLAGNFNSIISGVISGTGGLTKTGAGTGFLTGANTYSGPTLVNIGVLNLQNSLALGGTADTTVSSGAALQLQGGISVTGPLNLGGSGIAGSGALRNIGGSNSWSGTITIGATCTIDSDTGTLDLEANIINSTFITTFTNIGTIILNGALGSGTGAVIKNGTGLLSLGGANSYTGTTTINGGTVQFSTSGSASSASAVTINAGCIMDLNSFNQSVLSLAGSGSVTLGNGALTVNNSATTTFSGVMSGAGSLVQGGTGTMTLSGTNTYAGGTTVNAGTISIAADNGLGNASGPVTLNGGTLATTAALTSARAITLGAGGGGISIGGGNATFSGVISGPGALTKTGGKTLTLTGSNTYLGGTTNGGGSLVISSDSQLGNSAGPITFTNATLSLTAPFSTTRSIYLNSGTNFLLINAGVTNTFSGVISGAAAVTKSGTGFLVLTGNNTFTNTLSISAGTLLCGASGCLPFSAPVNVSQSGAILNLNNFTETIGGLSGPGKVILGSGALIAGENNSSTVYSGVISGTGSLTKVGTGLMTVSGANTYSGITTAGAGTLQIGANQRIASASSLVVSNGAIFDLNSFSQTVSSLAGGGNVTLGSGSLTAGNAGSQIYSGNMSGTGTFTKVGTGTQTFGGANTYSGATTVSGGNLQVSGSSPNSAVTIASAATLSGSGAVGTAVVNSGATNSPGAGAPGTLSSGSETWAAGGTYICEINNAAGTQGVNWNWLNISGVLNITANSGGQFNLKLVSLTPANAAGQVTNFNNTVTYIWTIASASGGISGFNAANFNINASAFQNPLGAGSFTLSVSGNNLNLIFTSAAQATIKDVQSGTLISSGNGTNIVALGAAVNPTNAFLVFNTRHNSTVPGGSMIRGYIASSNTVAFVRATTETSTMNIQWYVAEYSAGVNVQSGQVNQTNTTIDIPITPVSATNRAFVLWSKTPDPAETSFTDCDPVVGGLTSASNLEFRVTTAPSSVPVISWQVIDFPNPASIYVQSGSVTNLTGTNLLTTATLNVPVIPSSTLVLAGYRTTSTGTAIGARMLRAQLTNANTITFDRSISGAPDNIAEIAWQAVQLNDGSLVQNGSVNFASGIAETNVVFGSSINTNRAIAFASVQPAGGQNTGRSPSTGTVLGVGSATLAVASGSQVVLDRNNTSSQADIGWMAIALGPGSILALASGSSAISADTTGGAYTSLIGPTYTEIQSGNVGTGTIILNAPAGFIFDTNAALPTVLITRVGGNGANSLNINGVASGTSAAMTSVNQSNLTFTVTSASSGGVTCSLTWQNIRVRPSAGTPLASGSLVDIGTAVIQGVTTNLTVWGFLTEVVGAPTKLALATTPSSSVTAGVDFPQQPVIQIQDQFGNLCSANNTNLITATSSGTDTNNINGSMTVAGGVAAFNGMSYQVAQVNTITFSSSGLASKTSGNITVSAGAASQVAVVTQPSATAQAGISFSQQPVVQLQDQFGNLRKTDNSTVVTATIDQGSGSLFGTQTSTAVNGVVTFTNLSYQIPETITIDFTASGIAPGTSTAITVGAGPASQLVIQTQPSPTAAAGAPFAQQPVIQIQDQFGNLCVANNSTVVTASRDAGSGSGILQGTVNVTAVNGVATFASLANNMAGTISVDFNSGGLTGATSSSILITPANSALAVSTSANPSPTGSNVTFTATVTAVSPGSGTPTGAIQFLADGTALGSPAALSGGIAAISLSSLSKGSHAVTAQYAGDGSFFGCTNSLSPNQLIDSRPVAGSVTLQRSISSGVKVRATTLLANGTDPDGDVLALTSVSATSASGGTIVTNGGWTFYKPPTGFTNADSFSYVIADSYGLQATGTVSIVIFAGAGQSQNISSVVNLGNNSSRIYFSGIPGRTYTIQYAGSLQTPVWQALGTAATDMSGNFNFTDSSATNPPSGFYRSTYP